MRDTSAFIYRARRLGREARAGLHEDAGRSPASCTMFEALLANVHMNPLRNNMCKAYIDGYDGKKL